MQTIRTFIAIPLPPEICRKANALIREFKDTGANVKWVRTETMHLTLKFLGDIHNIETPKVCATAAEAVKDIEPFQINMRGCGAFPDAERARTVWIGVDDEDVQPMRNLHKAIDDAMYEIGYAAEPRLFSPHLTIGRVKRGGSTNANLTERILHHAAFEAGGVDISEATIFGSFLDKSGPSYEVLGHAPLGE